jgi:hypothetical protein
MLWEIGEYMKIQEQDLLLAEVIIKLSALERLLVKSGIIVSDDLISEMKKISEEIVGIVALNNEGFLKKN